MSDVERYVWIDRDEWYPVYTIEYVDSAHLAPSRLPEELIERAELAFAEFEEVQRLLGEAWRGPAR